MKPGALSFIPDLSAKLFELLDQYDRYNYILKNKNNFNTITMHSCGQLTWHDGVIPSNEIWVMTFQICNTLNPNSTSNTCIFCIFMAYDSVTNLHIGLDRYKEQIKDLQERKWRYTFPSSFCSYGICVNNNRDKALKIFMSGDYELLCRLYGISGASGTYIHF